MARARSVVTRRAATHHRLYMLKGMDLKAMLFALPITRVARAPAASPLRLMATQAHRAPASLCNRVATCNHRNKGAGNNPVAAGNNRAARDPVVHRLAVARLRRAPNIKTLRKKYFKAFLYYT